MHLNPRRLTRTEARRIAIRAQMLSADRPRDLAAVVDRLTFELESLAQWLGLDRVAYASS